MLSSIHQNGGVTSTADFVAGFVYGMTGDNHLTEIEACFQGGELMTTEIEKGIADIKKGGWDNDTQAALQFGLAALQIPQSLSTCENMDTDIAAIESWAQIFTDPAKLSATLAKHYAFHKAEIQGDITTLETDWDADLFFQAGDDLAALMTVAVGPIESQNGAVTSTADFVAGFVYGMTGDNHLTEIEACFQGGELMTSEIELGIADIKKGGWDNDTQAALQFGLAALQIPQSLSTCENMDTDIAAIEAWAQIFTDPSKLATVLAKHYAFHKAEIQGDITTLETDWDADLFFQAGDDLAALMTVAVGPIETTWNDLLLPPLNLVPDFTAGLIYGFTGDNHLDELRTCMKDINPLVDDAEQAIADLKSLKFIEGVEDLGNIIWLLPDAVSSCDNMDDDMTAIMAWADIFKHPTKLAKTVSKNWIFHGKQAKKDIASEEANWEAQKWFAAGQSTAGILVDLVGPVDAAYKATAKRMPLLGLLIN